MSDADAADAAAVKARLMELTRKFVARSQADVAQMREGLARLGTGDVSALARIHLLAHRACGTSGTLGLCAVSDAAAEIERLVEACPKDALPDAEVRAEIAARIDAMAAQLALA